MKIFKRNKKSFVILIISILLILSGTLSWNFYFSKYKIFSDYEKQFTEAVQRYYEFNQQYLPEKNEIREITLQDLYDGGHISDLYIPKTKKLCDSTSWVRVYQNDSGNYEYTTYLKCGSFESNVDHIGPEITLNGESEITLSLGSTYEEFGVKSVKDNSDGEMNINDVTIDTSKVNTSKVGTYEVTYTIRDSAYNKTIVTRKVIVAQNLTEVVINATDDSNYYRGESPNNYLLFSGMLWRIVGVDDEGNVKIVTQNNIANVSYATESVTFDNSNIKDWLNNYFYSKLYDTSYIKEDNIWCLDVINNLSDISSNCSTYSQPTTVGLLSLYDYNATKQNDSTYLNFITEYWLLNRKDSRFVYNHLLFRDNGIDTNDGTNLSGVRPVLILKKDLYIVSGNGYIDAPYYLGDYKTGKENELLNTRLIGEHVSYFGMSFRIADIDKDGYVKLVSTGYLKNNTTNNFIYSSYDNENNIRKFDPSEEGNIANQLNNELLDYIDDSLIIKHEYILPTYDVSKKYFEFETSTFQAKVSIPASYEIFSATNEQMIGQANYWLLDYVDGNCAFMINSANGKTFTIDSNSLYLSNGFKLVFYVNKNVKIKGGNGTSLNPYVIK